MKKLIRHKWIEVAGTYGKTQQYECIRCLCKKKYWFSFGQVMYTDRFGKIHYRAPECVLPNTKLK